MSGGERSFTTVSLLLAMWELSPGPIRCLDEWDVFLDHANRQVAANMLVSFYSDLARETFRLTGRQLQGARDSAETQYLLITPQVSYRILRTNRHLTIQDMTGINVNGPGNKIIKMADPIRNQ